MADLIEREATAAALFLHLRDGYGTTTHRAETIANWVRDLPAAPDLAAEVIRLRAERAELIAANQALMVRMREQAQQYVADLEAVGVQLDRLTARDVEARQIIKVIGDEFDDIRQWKNDVRAWLQGGAK